MRLRSGLVIAALVGCAPAAFAKAELSEARKWRILLPTVRAATDCLARAVLASPAAANDARQENWADAVRGVSSTCEAARLRLTREHDRLYGPGTGSAFLEGPYTSDLPRALRARIQARLGPGEAWRVQAEVALPPAPPSSDFIEEARPEPPREAQEAPELERALRDEEPGARDAAPFDLRIASAVTEQAPDEPRPFTPGEARHDHLAAIKDGENAGQSTGFTAAWLAALAGAALVVAGRLSGWMPQRRSYLLSRARAQAVRADEMCWASCPDLEPLCAEETHAASADIERLRAAGFLTPECEYLFQAGGAWAGSPEGGQAEEPEWCRVLGVSVGATPEEIKSAYRAAVKSYHPDLVAGLGRKLRLVAAEEIKRINLAYAEARAQLALQ